MCFIRETRLSCELNEHVPVRVHYCDADIFPVSPHAKCAKKYHFPCFHPQPCFVWMCFQQAGCLIEIYSSCFFACLILRDQLNALSSQGSFSRDVSYFRRPVMSSGIKHLLPKCFQVKALSFMGTVLPSRQHYASCFSANCRSKLASVPNQRMVCTNSMTSVRTSPCLEFVFFIYNSSQVMGN